MLDLIELGGKGKGLRSNGSVASRLMEASFNLKSLRNNDVLLNREWLEVDRAVTQEVQSRLVGVGDLLNAGLTMPLQNALGTTVVEFQKAADMTAAAVDMSAETASEKDRMDYGLDQLAIPVIHKEFSYNARALAASRRMGTPLDTTSATLAARKVAEAAEDMLFNGSSIVESSAAIYGYKTHPDANAASLAGGAWSTATAANILDDVFDALGQLRGDGFYGPYWIYIPSAWETALDKDYVTTLATVTTVRQRILAIESIKGIKVADRLTGANAIFVQPSPDVVKEVVGFQPTTVSWESRGGMTTNFMVMSILVPMIRSTYDGKCGVCVLS